MTTQDLIILERLVLKRLGDIATKPELDNGQEREELRHALNSIETAHTQRRLATRSLEVGFTRLL